MAFHGFPSLLHLACNSRSWPGTFISVLGFSKAHTRKLARYTLPVFPGHMLITATQDTAFSKKASLMAFHHRFCLLTMCTLPRYDKIYDKSFIVNYFSEYLKTIKSHFLLSVETGFKRSLGNKTPKMFKSHTSNAVFFAYDIWLSWILQIISRLLLVPNPMWRLCK